MTREKERDGGGMRVIERKLVGRAESERESEKNQESAQFRQEAKGIDEGNRRERRTREKNGKFTRTDSAQARERERERERENERK